MNSHADKIFEKSIEKDGHYAKIDMFTKIVYFVCLLYRILRIDREYMCLFSLIPQALLVLKMTK